VVEAGTDVVVLPVDDVLVPASLVVVGSPAASPQDTSNTAPR
jgi:hypothetical protein